MAKVAILFRKSMNVEKDVTIFMNHRHNESYYGDKIFSDPEGDFYMYPQDVEPEKLTHFLIKLPELNPDILVEKFPNIKKISVKYQIMKGHVTDDCIRMILL